MKKYIFLFFAVLASAVSCNLDRFPLDKESLDTYLQDESQCQSFSNTFYDDLFNGNIWDAQNDLYMEKSLPALIRGGNARTTPSSGGGWSFTVLRGINTMLGHMDNCKDPQVRQEYTALARFFRAYYYYKMVRDFGDVPWYDHELGSTETDELYKPRDSRDYVFEKMLEDMDFAIEVLPKTPNLYRVTSWTVLALKSRMCLFEGTWRKYHGLSLDHDADYYLKLAADAARTFIETSPYVIWSYEKDPSMSYTMLFSQMTAPIEEYVLA
ncbi:MAG: RagB/SusD family nutrient uptake outer membrane protein, partial [Clostridium sp.]|nr:RagB/SusD family nutrient uptake outer membrane protein [Clostridium sp.]